MSLFRDSSGAFIYAGPKFSDREKRVAAIYGALIDSSNDPEGVGVVASATHIPGQDREDVYQSGGSLGSGVAIKGHSIRSMPQRMRFGRTGDAGVDHIDGFYQMGGAMMPRTRTDAVPVAEQRAIKRAQAQTNLAQSGF